MFSTKPYLKYLALLVLVILVGSMVHVIGQTPQFIDATIAKMVADLEKKQGIYLTLGDISIQGFLTIQVEGFKLEKKDIGLLVQAKAIQARLSPLGYWFSGNPVSRLEIDTPEVLARLDLNFQESEPQSFKPGFSLNELIVRQGRAEILLNNQAIQIVNFYTNSKVTPKLLDIRSLLIQTPEVRFVAAGIVRLDNSRHLGLGSDLRFKLLGQLSQIPEIRQLSILLDANMNLEGQLRYPSSRRGLEFEGRVSATAIQIDTVSIASFSALVFLDRSVLELRQAQAGFAGTTCYLSGMVKLNKQLNFAAEVDASGVSLYQLLSDLNVKDSWVDLNLETRGSVEGQIKPRFELNGHAKGQASHLIVQNQKAVILETAYPIDFDLELAADKRAFQFKKARFSDGKSRLLANCDLFLDKRPGMWLEAQWKTLNFQSIRNRIATETYEGVGEAKVSIEGAYEHLKIRAPLMLSDFRFEGLALGNLTGVFSFEENQIFVNQIQGHKKSLEYGGDLWVGLQDLTRIKLDATLQRGQAEDLSEGLGRGSVSGYLFLEGPIEKGHRHGLNGDLELSGPVDVTAHFKQGAGSLKVTNSLLGDIDFLLRIEEEQLKAKGLFKESHASADVLVSLDQKMPFSMALFMPYGPILALFPKVDWLETFNAQAGIYLNAEGSLGDIQDARVVLGLSPAVFYLGTLKYLATSKVQAEYKDRQLVLKPALFKSAHGDKIELAGSLNENRLDLDVQTQGDLWLLTHLDERVEGAYGDFEAKLQIKGPWQSLAYFGKAEIAPGSYISLRDYPPGLTQLSGQVNLDGDRANLSLKGQADDGHFSLNGFVNMTQKSLENIQVNLVEMPIYYSSFLTGIADGFLKLEGPFVEPTLSGDVKFSQLLITKELSPAEFKAPRSRAKKQAVKLDVKLTAQDNIRIESKSFNAELKGNLNLVGTSNSPGLIGELSVVSGEIYFRNNYYHVLKARANFDNPFRVDPYIDVEANSQILDYDVTVRAQGQLAKPKLLFSSRPSLPQQDLFSLIMFGFSNRDYRDNLGVARSAGLEALSAYSGIGERVLNALPDSHIDEFRLGTLYSQTGGVTSSVVLGMQVYKGTRLRFQAAMVQNSSGNREKRLELEKYIDKRWRWR